MKARDITYVVHGMLRPILAAEHSGQMSTYHLQYWTRHHPVKPPEPRQPTKTPPDFVAKEFASRAKKAQQWSDSHKTLGKTAKTNVARPRALIAVTNTLPAENDNSNHKKQRAALWKSRIYCDQAYQALQAVVDRWKASGSASAQPHLVKLFKCLGISVQMTKDNDNSDSDVVHKTYAVDAEVLRLLLKLNKGKVLLARVLEQALLPPAVVPVLLPVALEILCGTAADADDRADDRVFAAWTVVLQTLPEWSGAALLRAVRAVQEHPVTGLSSTTRMQCTHALLQRGGAVAARDDEFAKEWNVTEQEFMNILAGL